MQKLLRQETKTYEKHRKKLLITEKGKFVVIRQDKILGVFNTERDAIRQGYKQVGNVPFLVKQVLEVEPIYRIISNLISV